MSYNLNLNIEVAICELIASVKTNRIIGCRFYDTIYAFLKKNIHQLCADDVYELLNLIMLSQHFTSKQKKRLQLFLECDTNCSEFGAGFENDSEYYYEICTVCQIYYLKCRCDEQTLLWNK